MKNQYASNHMKDSHPKIRIGFAEYDLDSYEACAAEGIARIPKWTDQLDFNDKPIQPESKPIPQIEFAIFRHKKEQPNPDVILPQAITLNIAPS